MSLTLDASIAQKAHSLVVWSITRTDTYLAAQYHRLARRKGKRRAVMAVAHSLLVIIYHVLKEKKPYEEL